MDRQAQQIVLENLRTQVGEPLAVRWSPSCGRYGDLDLPTFLHESGLELSDMLRSGHGPGPQLRRDAGLPTRSGATLEATC